MQNINTIPISFTIIWFLTAYTGIILSSSYIELILRVAAIALCIIFYFKKYIILILFIFICIFLLPITLFGFSLNSYLNIDFLSGAFCIVMLAYAHIVHRL